MNFYEILYKILELPFRTWDKFITVPICRKMLKKCGANVRIGKNVDIIWKNCSIGNDVYIGKNANFICAEAPLLIGNHVMFGPNVTIITGDHRIDMIGKYMSEVTIRDKLTENDLPVNIIGDNWIGANSTILKGVTIGKGAIVAAGAVVTKNVAPYSIVGGVPAKKIGIRFCSEEIIEHEKKLGL